MRTASLVILVSLPLLAGNDDSFLIRNALIHPVSGPDITNGSVLVVDGKIADVGPKVAAPKGVRVIEGKGLHVYPGMIDSATQLGISEISSVRETNDIGEIGKFNPQLRASIAVNADSEHIPVTRVNGITGAIVLPGTFGSGGRSPAYVQGQASLIRLDGWTWEEMEVLRSAALQLRLPSLAPAGPSAATGAGRPPRTSLAEARRRLEAEKKDIADFFEQARRYQKAKAEGDPSLKSDLRLEAMIPVLEGKVPVLIQAEREKAIREAIEFADKQKIRLILADVREPGTAVEEIRKKGIPVILGPTLELPLDEDDPYDSAFTLAGELHRAGVKFAFGSFGNQFARNLPYQAANAVAFGLPYHAALRAVTLTAAEIWGVADRIGSIDKGKIADLVVTDGDLLETKTQVKHLFISGKAVSLETRHTRLYQRYLNRP